jgi:hypothetical protein
VLQQLSADAPRRREPLVAIVRLRAACLNKQKETMMTSVLERAKAHAAKRPEIRIPEWGDEDGEPLVVYARLVTKAQMKKLRHKYGGDINAMSVAVVIGNIVDKDDNPVFSEGERKDLLEVSSAIIDRMAEAAIGVVDVKDQVKN